MNYRVLYFFNGRGVAVLTNGSTKVGEVADADIDRAIRYRDKFRANPARHTYGLAQLSSAGPTTNRARKK